MNKSEETEEIKTFPLCPYLLQGQQALPNCKPVSTGRPGDPRYTTPLPHPTTPLIQTKKLQNGITEGENLQGQKLSKLSIAEKIIGDSYQQLKTLSQQTYIGLDKGVYPVNIFLISPQKHMLWVLIRSASTRHF